MCVCVRERAEMCVRKCVCVLVLVCCASVGGREVQIEGDRERQTMGVN